jgi:uncharacterized protein (DUF1778 family)
MRVGGNRTNIVVLPDEKEMIIKAAKIYQLKWTTYIRRVAVSHAEQTLRLYSNVPSVIPERIEIIEESENG